MIKVYPYEGLGKADYGWLQANYHFSFAKYYNRNRMSFGALKAINDDKVASGMGFDMHPHKDMEIITFIRKGQLNHNDNKGNRGIIHQGQVQVMSAGTGIFHSEHNLGDEATSLYQIWIEPREKNLEPRWESHDFPKEFTENSLSLLVSGDGKAPLFLNQDAYIYAGNLSKDTDINHKIYHQAYILVSKGKIELEGKYLKQGDGAEVKDMPLINIKSIEEAEIILIDVPE